MMLSDETYELVSYAMGVSSVFIWLCAQMPQILKNWRRHSVEGLSAGFLLAWVAGDAANLAGCFLTHQLGVQVLLASYYCIVDVVLVAQFVLYRPKPEVLDGVTMEHDHAAFSDDNTNHRRASRLEMLKLKMVNLIGLAGTAQAMPTQAAGNSRNTAGASARNWMASDWVNSSSLAPDWSWDVGYLVAYFSTCMYLFSRLPQIYHNFQRKSTTGVSMMLFTAAFLGNLTYTLSILLAPQSMGRNANQKEFLLNELSYILGAAGTMLFDCIILGQWYWYQRRHHRRRSTAAYDRIQRPYLGTPRPSTSAHQRKRGEGLRLSGRRSSRGRNSINEMSPLLPQLPQYDENPIDESP